MIWIIVYLISIRPIRAPIKDIDAHVTTLAGLLDVMSTIDDLVILNEETVWPVVGGVEIIY